MYKDITQFLSAEPKWIEEWLNTPVKAKYIQNPLEIIELLSYTFTFLDLFGLKKCIAVNDIWRNVANMELHRRQKLLVKKYWNIVAECKKTSDELNTIYNREDNPDPLEARPFYDKYFKL